MGSEEINTSEESRSHLKQLVAIGVIASVIGIALGLLIDWFPTQASTQAETVDTVWDVLIIFSVPVFVLVMTVVLYCVWRYRMKPGQELMDGPPIHGNTRLEIIWTAIPAIDPRRALLLLLRRADRHRGGQGELARGPRRRRAVHLDVPLQGRLGQGRRLAAALRPARQAGELHRAVARRDPRLLGAGLPDEDRRGAGDRHAPAHHAEDQRRVPRRLRGAVRARACRHAPDRARRRPGRVRQLAQGRARRARAPAARRPTRRRAAERARPTARRSSPTRAAAAATRWRTPARPAASGPRSTRGSPGKDEAFIEESIVDPSAEVTEGFSDGLMPPNYGDTLQPAELDALVKYLAEVTK